MNSRSVTIGILVLLSAVYIGVSGFAPRALAQVSGVPQGPAEPYISISPDLFYPFEELLYIEGRAEPNAIVTVQIRKEGAVDKPVRFTVKADAFGEWVVAEKTYLSAGNWQVRARQQTGGLLSGESNPRVIRSVATGITVFGMTILYATVAAIAIAVLAVIAGILIYFRRKIARLKSGLMERQLKDTEDRFRRGFAEIRKDLMDQLRDLAVNSQGRAFSSEEIEKRDHILRELEELEKNLEHDVGDIGKRY